MASKLIGIGCSASDVFGRGAHEGECALFHFFKKNKIYLTAFHLKRLAAVLISFVRECTHLHADREDPVDVSGDRRKMTRTPPSVVRNGHTR